MKGKEEMLNILTNRWQSISPMAKALRIQYYQAKLILEDLIKEGKAESFLFHKRTKYRKITPEVALNVISS